MALTDDLSNFARKANGAFNSITANATAITAIAVGGVSINSTTFASNTFTIGTAVYFVDNGNVGIGNTTPNARLQVTGTANVSGNVVVGGILSDSIGNVRDIPVINQTTTYTLANTDAGETISTNSGITVNGALLYTNFVASVFNNSTASITITSGAGVTMHLAGTATTGNRTLAQRGICTIYCVAANTFVISGAGLT